MIEFLKFLRAVGHHWLWLVTGATFSVIFMVWPRIAGSDISTRAFWGIVALCLIAAFFLAWRDEHRLRVQIDEKLKPKLEITFEGRSPYIQDTKYMRPGGVLGHGRLYRVRVKNIGGSSISRNVVTLANIEPNNNQCLPVRLHIMHDNPSQGMDFREEFPLDPDQAEFIDLIEERTEVGELLISSVARGVYVKLPLGRYTFTVKATSENAVSQKHSFTFDNGAKEASRLLPT